MGPLVKERTRPQDPSIGETLVWATALLKSGGVDTPRVDAECLLASLLSSPRLHLYAAKEERLPAALCEAYRTLILRRRARVPLAYLTGMKEFWSLAFKVTPAVLIPRPETEVLVETALTRVACLMAPVIVDVGTGSGVIAVTMAKMLPRARVYATDISEDALQVAGENARAHGVVEQIAFLQGDLVEAVRARDLSGRCDLIISNPPYVATGDLGALPPEVRYEPVEALDGGPDGLRYHRRLIRAAPALLRPGGYLALEIAPGQGSALAKSVHDRGDFTDVAVMPDLSGRQRVITGEYIGPRCRQENRPEMGGA